MAVQKFVFGKFVFFFWVGSKGVAGVKTTFFAIFDPIWTHIMAEL